MADIMFAGIGGQGVLTAGKILIEIAAEDGKNVSWTSEYSAEMRGGTASCSVIISDEEVGSPIISQPDVLIAMNLPSFEKFEPTVKAGGIIIADSSLIEAKSTRTDIDVYYIPATALASDMGKQSLANMIILGKLLKVMNDFNEDEIKTVLGKVIPPKKADMLDINLKAMQLGSEN